MKEKLNLRFQWNRVENEHLNNVGKFRAVKTVPLPFRETDSDGWVCLLLLVQTNPGKSDIRQTKGVGDPHFHMTPQHNSHMKLKIWMCKAPSVTKKAPQEDILPFVHLGILTWICSWNVSCISCYKVISFFFSVIFFFLIFLGLLDL